MPDVATRVEAYLEDKASAHVRGTDGYFAVEALRVALRSFRDGNYGIGAIAVVRRSGTVYEYRAGNAMVSGQGLVDHAETRALLRIASGEAADSSYAVPPAVGGVLPEDGIAVYGTLEPCPMCASVMTNAGVARSVSTVVDGRLVHEDLYLVSDGAANVLGDKYKIQPRVWRDIQQGRKLRFELLDIDDPDLAELSQAIFIETRVQIDKQLAERPPKGGTASIRDHYERRASTVSVRPAVGGRAIPPSDGAGEARGAEEPAPELLPFRSSYRALYREIGEISPSVPNAIARAIAYEDERNLETPRVYVSTAITSGGYRRDSSLALGEVIARNNHAALLMAHELQAHDAPHVTPYEVMLPVELGPVEGWGDTDYLLFYFAWLGGLTEVGAAWLVDQLSGSAYQPIRAVADDRRRSNEDRWPQYKIFVEVALTTLAVAEARPGAKRADGADLMLQLIDVETSLGCRAERLFADARGLTRLAPTFGPEVSDKVGAQVAALNALGVQVGALRKAVELVPLSLP
jgi:tRNA(Arg) A34 adenosine deaminase TadA